MKKIGLTLTVLVLLSGPADAATLFGLTDSNALVKFDSNAPSNILDGPIAITGLAGGENILAIDYRPATGALYAVSSLSRLFVLNTVSGAATLVGTFSPPLAGTEFGFDVIPSADRIRVVSNTEQNIRVNPDSGNLSTTDNALSYAGGDVNAGANPNVTAIAYTNNYPGASTSTLFLIDTNLDILATTTNPNGGSLTTVGALGVNTTAIAGFDIYTPTGTAFAALETSAGQSRLYVINLSTGAATLVGNIGSGLRIRGLAATLPASALIGLTTTNGLIHFNANAPGTTVVGPFAITGLDGGEVMQAIDYRPATGELLGLSSLSRLYRLDAASGAATLIAPLSTALTGTTFGFDCSPVTDSIRITTNTGQNLRANPDTGAVTVDTPLAYAPADPHNGTPAQLAGSAYINNVYGAGITLLYGIDSSLDVLVTQSPQDGGVLNTVGALGVNAVGDVGFDIEPVLDTAYATMIVGGTSRLYTVDIHSAAATLVGAIGGGHQLRGLAVVLFGASPPTPVIATGSSISTPQVTVTYSAVTGADHYGIYRLAAGEGSNYTLVGVVFGLQFVDTGVALNKSYLYKVRASGPGSNTTPDSTIDLATTITFTDDPPTVATTVVSAAHLAQLRTGVNAVRELAGLAPASVTDAASPGVVIKAIHITELRAALDAARTLLGLPGGTYTRTLTPGTTLIAAVDVSELRTGIK